MKRSDWVYFALGANLAFSLNLCIIFFLGYFSPTQSVLVHVNAFHEANVEAVLFPLILVSGFVALVRIIRSKTRG